MTNKALQLFTDEYLQSCQEMTPEQIVLFLDDFRKLNATKQTKEKSILISIKIPETTLRAFKQKSSLNKIAYQTKIKELMNNWLKNND